MKIERTPVTGREDENLLTPQLRALSGFFRLLDGQWRQVHHHGSIDDPALWAAYQQAVRPA